MSDEEKKEAGFQVKDRRRFTEDGDSKPQAEAPPQTPSEPQSGPDQTTAASGSEPASTEKKKEAEERSSTPLPEINFATFVVSLSSSALIHLGIAPDPVSGETMCEPAYAKQTIDILAMLKEKTKGNLTKEEDQMMDGMLYDLRMRYIAEMEKKGN